MKYTDGRKFSRRTGAQRKNNDIYSNLGHPFDIKNKKVIFIGKEEKTYCLTNGKEYEILDVNHGKYNMDNNLRERQKKDDDLRKGRVRRRYSQGRYETSQGEDYFITIINDKGHKRGYAHQMFKIVK